MMSRTPDRAIRGQDEGGTSIALKASERGYLDVRGQRIETLLEGLLQEVEKIRALLEVVAGEGIDS